MQVEMTGRDDVEELYQHFACLNYDTMTPTEFESHTWVYQDEEEDGGALSLSLLVMGCLGRQSNGKGS